MSEHIDAEKLLRSELAGEPWPEPVPLDTMPDVPPFPVGVFVGQFGDYLAALAEAYQTPYDLSAMLALGVASGALAHRLRLEVREGWTEEPVLWPLVLQESGSRKSPVLSALMRPVHAWEREEGRKLASVLARAREARSVKVAQVERLRRDLAKPSPKDAVANRELLANLSAELAATKPPAEPILVVSDATTEALAKFLEQSGERALIASAEADVLDVVLGRYSEGRANVGLLCKAYNGEPERIRRKTGGNVELTRPLIALALTAQPGAVSSLLGHAQARARGFFARMLLAVPRDRVGFRHIDPAAVPASLTDAYALTLAQLFAWPTPDDGPTTVPLGAEGLELLRPFMTDHEKRMRPDGNLGDCREWAAKETGNLCRVALLLVCLDAATPRAGTALAWGGPPAEVPADALRRAFLLAPYLEAHQRATGSLGLSPTTALARRLLGWIRRERLGTFTVRDAYRACRPTTETARDVEAPLRLLVDCGHLRPLPPKAGPGRPSDAYEVNPATLRAPPHGQNGQNGQNPADHPSSVHSVHSVHGGHDQNEGRAPADPSDEVATW